jgi:hypothetical protein
LHPGNLAACPNHKDELGRCFDQLIRAIVFTKNAINTTIRQKDLTKFFYTANTRALIEVCEREKVQKYTQSWSLVDLEFS